MPPHAPYDPSALSTSPADGRGETWHGGKLRPLPSKRTASQICAMNSACTTTLSKLPPGCRPIPL